MNDTNKIDEFDTAKRPKWVWLITIVYVFSFISTIYSFYTIYNGLIPLNEAQHEYFSNLGVIDYAITAISSLLALFAAITLFMLKKITIKIWVVVFVFGILAYIYSLLTSNYLEVMNAGRMIGPLIGIIIMAVIYFYAKRLDARGYLK